MKKLKKLTLRDEKHKADIKIEVLRGKMNVLEKEVKDLRRMRPSMTKEKKLQKILLGLAVLGVAVSIITGTVSITGFNVLENQTKTISWSFIIFILSILLFVIYFIRKRKHALNSKKL